MHIFKGWLHLPERFHGWCRISCIVFVRAVDPIRAAHHSTSEVGSSEFSCDSFLCRVPPLSVFGMETRLDNFFFCRMPLTLALMAAECLCLVIKQVSEWWLFGLTCLLVLRTWEYSPFILLLRGCRTMCVGVLMNIWPPSGMLAIFTCEKWLTWLFELWKKQIHRTGHIGQCSPEPSRHAISTGKIATCSTLSAVTCTPTTVTMTTLKTPFLTPVGGPSGMVSGQTGKTFPWLTSLFRFYSIIGVGGGELRDSLGDGWMLGNRSWVFHSDPSSEMISRVFLIVF